MKVALISTSTYPSDQGIRHVSAMLKSKGHKAKIFFLPEAENYSKKYSEKMLDQLYYMCKDFDIIGISSYASTSVRALQATNKLRGLNKPIIWGGVHATISPEKCIDHVDLVCVGEGEHTMLELLEKLEQKQDITNIPNLWVRKDGIIYKNEIRVLVEDLDSLPPPDYDLEDHYILEKGRIIPFEERHLNGMIFFQTERGCPNSCSYCFTEQSLVLTEDGMKIIKDINIGEKVLTSQGRLRKVTKTYKRLYKGNMIEIKTSRLGIPTVCTPDHKLLILRKGKLIFEKASQIVKDDKLCLTLPNIQCKLKKIDLFNELKGYKALYLYNKKYGSNTIQKCINFSNQGLSTRKIAPLCNISKSYAHYLISKYSNNPTANDKKEIRIELNEKEGMVYFSLSKNKTKRYICLDDKFCRLVGYYLAEGNVHSLKSRHNTKSITFTFGKHEAEYIKDCITLIQTTLGVQPSISTQGYTTHIYFSNNVLGLLFKELFGYGARNKKIPFQFFGLDYNRVLQLLVGYMRGDGSKYLDASTVSPSLAYSLFMLSHKIGFTPRLYGYIKNDSYIDGRFIKGTYYYLLTFRGTSNREVLKTNLPGSKVNCPHKQRSLSNLFYKHYVLLPIASKKSLKFNGYVHNLEVEEDHTYTVNGLAVANCSNNILKQLSTGKGKLIRFNSMDYSIKEMARLKNKFKTLGVFDLRDETLFARPLSDFQEFNKRYKKEIGIRFKCLADPPTMNEQKLALLVDAGLTDIIIGIQGSERVNFEIYKRYIKDDQVLKAAEIVNKFKDKVAVMYDVITTNPYEGPEDILNLIKLLIKLPKPYYLSVNNLVFFFGTPLYDKAVKDGVIKTKKDSAFDLNYWDRWKHIRLKKKNAYLNLVLNLMRGLCTDKRYGLIPYFVLRRLIKPDFVKFNLKHNFLTYFIGFFVKIFDFVRENLAKPLYRTTPTSFKVWYDKVRYRV